MTSVTPLAEIENQMGNSTKVAAPPSPPPSTATPPPTTSGVKTGVKTQAGPSANESGLQDVDEMDILVAQLRRNMAGHESYIEMIKVILYIVFLK